mgnify:FL=1
MQSAMSIHYLSFYQPNCLIPINKNSRTADFAFGSFLFFVFDARPDRPNAIFRTPAVHHVLPPRLDMRPTSRRAFPYLRFRPHSFRAQKSRRRRKQIAVFPPPRGNVKVYRNPRNFSRETGVIFRNQTRDLMRRMMSFMLTLPSPLKSAASSTILRPDQPA